MPTPQENRFGWLAIQQERLTREQVEQCLQFQKQKADQGSKIPLWDCAVLQNMLSQDVAEKLENEAGDLRVPKLGEFTIVRKLGSGGMGAVYEGVDRQKRRAAIKVLAPHLAKERSFLTRFFREGQAAMKLQHKHIVGGFDIGEDSGHYFFAMEFVDGRSLRQVISERGAIPVQEATELVLQVADALAYAHESKIIHRDIKPDNIMLTTDGVAKLTDLGLARQVDSEMTALTRTGAAMGTPYYMAPEQVMDAKRADERSDIYSLGCTWYHMVTGQLPFEGETSFEVYQKHLKTPAKSATAANPKVPKGVALTIEQMMAKQADNRIQTARELCRIIQERCTGERDIRKELHVEATADQAPQWEMRVEVGGRLETRRMSMAGVRKRISTGAVTKDTPARRMGERGPFRPAREFLELSREFPPDYATAATPAPRAKKGAARSELRSLVQDFDKAKKSYRRSRRWKRIRPYLLELVLLLIAAALVWRFLPQIKGLLGR